VFVFGLPTLGLVVDPEVARDQGLPRCPQLDHPLMLTAPVVGHPIHPPGVRLVQDQQSFPEVDMGLGFLPQRRRVGRLSLQRAGKGIVGRGLIPFPQYR
jgi:hypothetical protein